MTITIRLVFALLGALGAVQVAHQTAFPDSYHSSSSRYLVWTAFVLGGAFTGWLIGALVGSASARGIRKVVTAAANRSASELLVGGIGLLLGLATAALLGLAISSLPYVGSYILLPLFLILAYVFASIGARKSRAVLRLMGLNPDRFESSQPDRREAGGSSKLVDTSAIIDGRLADIAATGFIEGELVIPQFVLEELQRVADSHDPQKRARGRRGLEIVHELASTDCRISTPEIDYADIAEVDAKLLRLAIERRIPIITTDYNLNKLAQIQNVRILNVNDLSNAVKTATLPGEVLAVKVIREGKSADQGVAYLEDGTMIVIEGGRKLIGETVTVEVTSILQNPSGKMIFTKVA
jgi:uncharacterized protein YacL